jgi:transcriptional regulator with XRE-family HTH domain
LREYRGLTQAARPKACDTGAVHTSQIEHGGRQVGRKLLAKLGKTLRAEAGLSEQDG